MTLDSQTIHIFGITWLETMTVITDLFIAVVALWAFVKIKKHFPASTFKSYYTWHFLLMAVGTALGGVLGHGLIEYTGKIGKLPGWLMSMGATSFLAFAVLAQYQAYLNPQWVKRLRVFNIIELIVFASLTVVHVQFGFVAIHTAYSLLVVVLGVGIVLKKSEVHKPAHWLFAGILCSIAAAAIFGIKLGFHTWFNHMDVSHLFLAASVFCFYKQAVFK